MSLENDTEADLLRHPQALISSLPTLEDLRPKFRQRLRSMYSGERQLGADGSVALDKTTRISEQEGIWIYESYRQLRPKRSLEVGLAYGFSTIYILAAIDQVGSGHHISVDPFQRSNWHGVGAWQAKQLDMDCCFELLEEFSVTALARFTIERTEFEFIFIDGNHRFDDVLVDFTLAAEACPLGGNIMLDDMWLPSVQTVASWIRANRKDFREIPTPIANIAHFERTAKDERNWDHFVPFGLERLALSRRLLQRVRHAVRAALPRH